MGAPTTTSDWPLQRVEVRPPMDLADVQVDDVNDAVGFRATE